MILTRLILPILSIVVCCIIGFSAFVSFTKSQANTKAYESNAFLIRSQTNELVNQLELQASDNSWWNFSYTKVHNSKPNIEWIEDTYGGSVRDANVVSGTIVFGPDGRIIYSYFKNDEQIQHYFEHPDLVEFLEQFSATDEYSGKSNSAIVIADNRTFILGASMFQTTHRESTITFPPERRPVLMFIRELDVVTLSTFGDKLNVEELKFVDYHPELVKNSLKIDHSFNENIINSGTAKALIWKLKLPGSDILNTIFWPTLLIIFFVILAFSVFLKFAKDMVDELAKTNKLKSEFIANMSHELRTPLNAVIGFSEIIKLEVYGKVENQRYREYAGHIHDSGRHLLSIINDILDISKIEANKWELHIEHINVGEELESCVSSIMPISDKKNINIDVTVAGSIIESDARVFKQIIFNLLSNAVKFTPDGGNITIQNTVSNSWEKVVVTDDGIGMSKDDLEHAMMTFTQVQDVYTRSVEGTGLGLPLVYKFVHLLGGDIDIRSKKGHGTTIEMKFPRVFAVKAA